MQNKEYDCPNSEPTIRNCTHPDIRKTAIWSHYLPRTPVSFLQDQRPGPQRPCRSRSPRSAFQAFLERVSPSLFHRWINRVKSAFPLTTAICGGPYRTQFWIPWLDSFAFVMHPKYFKRPLILKKSIFCSLCILP